MSGYLQRLVHTASQPAATVHPFAGSIFAASRENDLDRFASEDFVPAAKQVAPIASSVPQSEAKLDSPRSPAPSTEYRPITPVSVTGAEAQFAAVETAGVRGEPSTAPAPSAALLPDAEAESTQPRPRAIQERMFSPLLAGDAAAEPGIAIPAARANRQDFHAGRGPAAMQHESEDIQIRIGRIEVTAVQPPVARAAQAPNRGPSLDAYLNRRAR